MACTLAALHHALSVLQHPNTTLIWTNMLAATKKQGALKRLSGSQLDTQAQKENTVASLGVHGSTTEEIT